MYEPQYFVDEMDWQNILWYKIIEICSQQIHVMSFFYQAIKIVTIYIYLFCIYHKEALYYVLI
jgi:hypothetical protein